MILIPEICIFAFNNTYIHFSFLICLDLDPVSLDYGEKGTKTDQANSCNLFMQKYWIPRQ